MKALVLLVASGLVLQSPCKDFGSDPTPDMEFAIYRLLDTSIVARTAWDLPLESLTLSREPFIRAQDLKAYHWSTHTFEPVAALDSVLKQMMAFRGKSWGVPFVVMVGKQRIYLGAFWWAYSSLAPKVPNIEIITSRKSYTIAPAWLPMVPDTRGDPRIREALQKAGILVQ